MYVLNRGDLSLAWTYKLATLGDDPQEGQGSLSTPAFDGQMLYSGAGTSDAANSSPGTVYAIDPATHNARWFYGARGCSAGTRDRHALPGAGALQQGTGVTGRGHGIGSVGTTRGASHCLAKRP